MSQIYATMLRPLSLIPSLATCIVLSAQGFVPCAPYGGDDAVKDLIEQELRFPEKELAEGIKGSSVLIFSVMATGELRDLRIWRPLTPACDAEALRIGRLVRWHPATVADTPHDAEHYLEVPFDAKRYLKAKKDRHCAPPSTLAADSSNVIHEPKQTTKVPTPDIPNGMRGLPAYMSANLKYPPEAYKRDLQGLVRLDFVVEASGSVSNLRALDEVGGGCTAEAMRLVRSMCWMPAEKDGHRVRCSQRVEVQFRLVPRDR
jgi:periplasmic protein TonB